MSITVTLAKSLAAPVVVNQPMSFTVTVANNSASSVVLNALQVTESTESDAIISQPNILTPNMPVGLGNPVIPGSSSVSYAFQVIFNSPGVGPSPQSPGGAAPFSAAATPDANFTLTAMALVSDGSGGTFSLMVPVLSAIAPFPLAIGGALQLSQGFNLLNYLIAL